MPKLYSIRRAPEQIVELEQAFMQELQATDLKKSIIQLPFYNFVCYAVELFTEYSKTNLNIPFNLFILDHHFRKYNSPLEIYRRFIGFTNSWKTYSETDEGRLLLTFLRKDRNNKASVKMFLKIRKILLKNINQKILQEISLSHQDAVTVVHTMTIISSEQRRTLTKKINEYFITKNIKYVNNAKFNAAIICEYFIKELQQCKFEQTFASHNQKGCSTLKNPTSQAADISDEPVPTDQPSLQYQSFENRINLNTFGANQCFQRQNLKQNLVEAVSCEKSKKGLVNLQKCLQELNILKEKDMQIDNRFRKVTNSKL